MSTSSYINVGLVRWACFEMTNKILDNETKVDQIRTFQSLE